MEVNTRAEGSVRARGRPAQALYMPPAQRHRQNRAAKQRSLRDDNNEKTAPSIEHLDNLALREDPAEEMEKNNEPPRISTETDLRMTGALVIHTDANKRSDKEPPGDDGEALTKMTKSLKSMNLKCDVLQLNAAKNVKKSPIKLVQVDQWEELFNENENEAADDCDKLTQNQGDDYDDDDEENSCENLLPSQLEHILEIYDFPSNFRSADIMQIYSEMEQNTVYIKWLNDTHALLVLGSALQAKRALQIENPMIKSRPVAFGSNAALTAVKNCNLRPAMKRPETSMHAARRMITTALGAKTNVSREVQQREREALRAAKERRRTQQQNERDAWEGHPRPTTA